MPATTKLILLSRAWTAASLILLLLVLHGRGGHCVGLGMEAELEMDSEAHRRLLWEATTGQRYISYAALRGDVVPCSRTGVPYYNCRISTTANPYTRGCESITRQEFLDSGESVVLISKLKKINKLANKKVQLILTDKPKLICVDPSKMVAKGNIIWSDDPSELSVQVSNSSHFRICTPKKVSTFEDAKQRAWQWKKAIEDLQRSQRN